MKTLFSKFNNYIAFLIVFIGLGTGHLFGQNQTGRLEGQIVDPSGAVIPGARVSVKNQSGNVNPITVRADAAGSYQLDSLPPGKYTIMARAKGFADFSREFEIRPGQNVTLNAVLKIATQQLEMVVAGKEGEEEGQGRGVGVSSDSNAGATVITGKELDYLSDDPTDLGSQLLELAGPAAGPNGGQIYVDGFSSGYLPPKISIREVRINQNPFAAEQDRLGYGRVEVYTKPGSSQFHGQLVIDENNAMFNSANPFAPRKVDYNNDIITGDFWGPVKKNATGYLSFQRRNIHDTTPVNAIILDNNLNPTLFTENLAHPDFVTVAASRINYQITPDHLVIVRYAYLGQDDKNGGVAQFDLPSQAFNFRSYEHRVQISDNVRLGARSENDTRFEFKRSYDGTVSVNSDPEVLVAGAFGAGGNPAGRTIFRQDYYELQNHTLMTRGRHVIKFGGRLRADQFKYETTQLFNGLFIFDSLNAYQTTLKGQMQGLTPAQIRAAGGGPALFTISQGQPVTEVTAIDTALYIQDEWRVRPKLNIGYGLRYETQNVIHDHFDWAPRIGLAWGIGGGAKGAPTTVLRTGFGIFYDRFPTVFEAIANRLDGRRGVQTIFPQPNFFPNLPILGSTASGQSVALPTITQVSPDLKSPYTMQTGIALEHQFGKSTTTSVIYLHSRGVHQIFSRNVNAPLPGTFDPEDPASGIRPFGNVGNIYQYQSEGVFNQNQLITSLNLRTLSHLSITAKHTLSYATGTVITPGTNVTTELTFPSNQYDPGGDYGRSSFDIRHRLSVGTVIDLPKGFRLSPFFLLRSGTPFNIVLGSDMNGDTIFNDRPAFATDLSRPSVVVTRFGAFDTQPLPGQRIVPRNFGTGPVLYTLNVRLGKTFTFAEKSSASGTHVSSGSESVAWKPNYSVSFNIMAQNILNHLNVGPTIGSVDSPLFGQSNTLAGGAFSSASAGRRIIFSTSVSF